MIFIVVVPLLDGDGGAGWLDQTQPTFQVQPSDYSQIYRRYLGWASRRQAIIEFLEQIFLIFFLLAFYKIYSLHWRVFVSSIWVYMPVGLFLWNKWRSHLLYDGCSRQQLTHIHTHAPKFKKKKLSIVPCNVQKIETIQNK